MQSKDTREVLVQPISGADALLEPLSPKGRERFKGRSHLEHKLALKKG